MKPKTARHLGILRSLRRGAAVIAAASMMSMSVPAVSHADDPSFGEIAAIPFDVIFLRPLASIRLAAGAMFYLPAMVVTGPMALWDQNRAEVDTINETFILEPVDYIFLRPVGQDLAGR